MLPTLANVTQYSMTTSINHRITRNAQIRHFERFDIRKRVSLVSDDKELARNYIVSRRQMKQFEKQKEEFNGILNASVRTKMPSSDKAMLHDQIHWLKTLIFTPLQFIKAVANDQHNCTINIVHDGSDGSIHPSIHGWMDGWLDGWTDGQTDMHTYIHTYVRTYICTDRHINVHAQADG